MDKKYLNILEVPEVDFNSTDRLVVIDVSNNIKVLGKESLNVDLSDYYTKEATNELLNNKADKITVTELATKLKEDTDKLNKDITDLGNRVDSIPVITVDTEMNSESTNPVQNKAITNTITIIFYSYYYYYYYINIIIIILLLLLQLLLLLLLLLY